MPTNFVTYAQNAEDVLLWRALQHVEKGFYIDVGAQDPVVDSVTKTFYERGWHGINIEPVRHWYERLVQDRIHDLNLCVAASDHEGEMRLFEIEGTGLSTSNAGFAQRHREDERTVREYTVPCTTLDTICNNHHVGVVHFLKVDCEGAEKQALSGISLGIVRPWVILVEATEPMSTKQNWREWEHLLTKRGYKFIYFDGLNRFYLAEEHLALRTAFRTPPNPLDWAVRAVEIRSRESVDRLTDQVAQFQSAERSARAEAERDYLREDNERRKAELNDLRSAHGKSQRELQSLELQLAGTVSERDRLLSESERHDVELRAREAELIDLRNVRQDLQDRVEALLASQAELTSLRNIQQELQDRVDGLMAHQVKVTHLRDARQELQDRVNALLASHSWRITAPLRLCGQGARRLRDVVLAMAYVVLRPFAHLARPALRWLALREWIRSPVSRAFGTHSRLVNTARLFLFGAQPWPSDDAESLRDTEQASPDRQSCPDRMQAPSRSQGAISGVVLSERGRTVRRLMDEIQVDTHGEDEDAHRS